MSDNNYPHLFSPIQVGTMTLRNRIMVPTHAFADGNLLGTPAEAARFVGYYQEKARGGSSWVCGSSMHLRTPVGPGFEPSGMGAFKDGMFRNELYVPRAAQFAEAIHSEGAYASMQIVFMGGTPHGPSPRAHGFTNNRVSHVLTTGEIGEIVAEYAFTAGQMLKAGLDGAELHANNDDLLQWFMSPMTNDRDDKYGGSVIARLTLLHEVLAAIRAQVGPEFTLGARICMDERVAGGYDSDLARESLSLIDEWGLVDYLHLNVGNNWGETTYLPMPDFDTAHWTDLAGTMREVVGCPVIYTGRVTTPDVAEQIVASGQADIVGIVRSNIADPEFANKASTGRVAEIRPCVASNDCLSRVTLDGISFGCAVNPRAGMEQLKVEPAIRPKNILVIGGGPAGIEVAATAAERGHRVSLWEQAPDLGGQLLIAVRMPYQDAFGRYLDYQKARLKRAGVKLETSRRADFERVLAAGADEVVVATGATAYAPFDIPGIASAHVVDVRDVLRDPAGVGHKVVMVVEDDHMAPLGTADLLSSRGHDLTLVYRTTEFAPMVGRYNIGPSMARLFAAGATLLPMHRLVAIEDGTVQTADVYGGSLRSINDVDTVVLACGSRSDPHLHAELEGIVEHLHLIGDAYAPRRLTYATRQGDALGRML
ncbi:FAD-dependent oxidoreductase [Nocardia sp. 348MFTsu5.1]|uniref:oxidoreductase n=1 Tax=Nocardia sp. 348MFTsu5.1 TaxID=1172185 RepID=UPI0003A6CAF3|nr:FAD-dependent oxidoreductase [Nocardia sp. 348MFTsu5.1]